MSCLVCFFFFKQKTAYEMRISDWSSDVCSSDLTWPSMNDHFVPEGIDWSAGVWMAVTNDPFLINFLHRWWAWATALALLLLARALWRRGGQGEAAGLVLVRQSGV